MSIPHESKPRILIVDDTPSNILMLGVELKQRYDVIIATNGQKALQRAFTEPRPDLILLDIMMPDMDGYEVCRRLKDDPRTKDIPVIFITAKNAEDDETLGLELGAVDYITKPFSLAIVRARVRTHLELKRKSDMLEALSSRDCLTGMFNRRRFDEALETEWKRALRTHAPLSLLMMDIDYFKNYNDAYGHLSGDECLKAVAFAMSSTLRRPADFIARYGGEEFVAVLSDTDITGAVHIGECIRKAVEDSRIQHEHSLASECVTLSVGAATTVPRQEVSSLLLVEVADNALYDAKQAGRNRVKYRQL